METAEIVAGAHNLEVISNVVVGEVRYGTWEGKTIKKLVKKKPEWLAVQHFPSRFRFPKGESLREVQHRAVTAIEKIAGQHEKEMVAVVSHADVIKLVLAHYLGIHIDLFQRIGIAPASVSVMALMKGGTVRVLRVNDDGPLRPPAEFGKDKSEE
jgi:probable phosphoglycerate mutase